MIKGVHTMFFTSKPEELRQFIKDKLGFPYTDVGGGWLIFDLPEANMGCHPDDPAKGKPSGLPYISFYCDDIESTVSDLKEKGVVFSDEISKNEYGYITHFQMPGDFEVELFQPLYTGKE